MRRRGGSLAEQGLVFAGEAAEAAEAAKPIPGRDFSQCRCVSRGLPAVKKESLAEAGFP
jgi:hypothetical protein